MTTFNLNLDIDAQSLPLIRSAQLRIMLAKPVGGSGPLNVIWQSFDPFGSNTVTWDEEFGLYASDTKAENGATIRKMSAQEPAVDENYYSFTAGATFEGPFRDPRVGPGQYAAQNSMPNVSYDSLTFGLTQAANVNGKPVPGNPLNAVTVLPNNFVTFTPITTVFVWLESNQSSATVITNIQTSHTITTFSGGITTRDLVYDPDLGVFVPKKTPKAGSPDDAGVRIVRPLVW